MRRPRLLCSLFEAFVLASSPPSEHVRGPCNCKINFITSCLLVFLSCSFEAGLLKFQSVCLAPASKRVALPVYFALARITGVTRLESDAKYVVLVSTKEGHERKGFLHGSNADLWVPLGVDRQEKEPAGVQNHIPLGVNRVSTEQLDLISYCGNHLPEVAADAPQECATNKKFGGGRRSRSEVGTFR